ncbi:MAG TPA: hypothetical protein VFJ12_15720 [Segeticoccus sp.]|jgi:hypothetical protein|nr:hypothetical protein [Segeticoccus sp.]
MLSNDKIFIDAELAYRMERALSTHSRWEAERTHPLREAAGRWWHQLADGLRRRPEAPAVPLDGQTGAAESGEPAPATEARVLEHTRA